MFVCSMSYEQKVSWSQIKPGSIKLDKLGHVKGVIVIATIAYGMAIDCPEVRQMKVVSGRDEEDRQRVHV